MHTKKALGSSGVDIIDLGTHKALDRQEIAVGLRRKPRRIHPKYFYDTRGSQLFEEITRQPEYYPTTTEVKIYKEQADVIAKVCGVGSVVVEPGSGNSEKIRYLLDAIRPSQYVPIDIAGDFLSAAAEELSQEYSWLDVLAINADFYQLKALPDSICSAPKLIFYPGSTIGNMTPDEALGFLQQMRGWLTPKDRGLLVGIDLHKDQSVLEPAYNDNKGITAAFNKNILDNVNSIAGTDFDQKQFKHRALYNVDSQRIEMYLEAKNSQRVNLSDEVLQIDKGESILTEYSYKYTLEDIKELAGSAGFNLVETWLDQEGLFSVSFLELAK